MVLAESTFRRVMVGLLAIVCMTATTCSKPDSSSSAEQSAATTNDAVAVGAEPRYAEPGPYPVGVTTLDLSDRKVEVYYPAQPASTESLPRATYLQTDPIPPSVLAGLPAVPPDVDLSVQLPAFRDVPAADDGPFPLVLFSHGAGGWRGVYGYPLSGLASWGFVVASTDYQEYGLLAQFGAGGGDRSRVADVARSTIDLMLGENDRDGSVLAGAVDNTKIAAVGHSAGGGTMFRLLDDPRVGAIIGWAPVGPPEGVTSTTPTMIIAGQNDVAITPADARGAYDALQSPKRLVMIGNMGHNAFSDACLAIRNGTDLIGLAKQLGIAIPDRTLDLGRNGCEPADLDTAKGWSIIQHFTVAQLRDALHIDPVPVGLGPGIADAFPPVEIQYEHQP